ncbi:MAG: hypothetical protein ACRDPE_13295 [Solirubrobacterales bacterium]
MIAEIGHFVGPLSFHGANGFTSFKAHRLRGSVTRFVSWVCRISSAPKDSSSIELEGVLDAVAGKPSGSTFFDAVTEPAVDNFPASSTYTATSEHREGSVDILETIGVPAPAPLAIPDLTAALPATMTFEPPAPFSGSATIEAPSRATATLSGDLAIDFPATGETPLTGPGVDAGLCRDYTCSGSLPRALRPQRPKYGLGITTARPYSRPSAS